MGVLFLAAGLLGGCAASGSGPAATAAEAMPAHADTRSTMERDRQAILAMTGDYRVTFDFLETVSFAEGYTPKDRYEAGGYEIVRVIEDRGDFISLQHILVAGRDKTFAIKHWRQDWTYEPDSVLTYIGGNAWEARPVSDAQARGKWSQIVYQVDDSPRYGALAAWSHGNGISEWTPPAEWRPLPRRDATKRSDYHAIDAVNRHTITPEGWVHEQDNTKLILSGPATALVREIGVNTYRRSDDFDVSIAETYWNATKAYWAEVREAWAGVEARNQSFGLTIQGEPEELYGKLLDLAGEVKDGAKAVESAATDARDVIGDYTTANIGKLQDRLGGGLQRAEY